MELYKYLDSIGLKRPDKAFKKIHYEWNKRDRETFMKNLFVLVDVSPPLDHSLFNFSVNRSLAGFPTPCSDFDCRINNIDNLARFASLYADTIFIPSPFDKYQEDTNIPLSELFFDVCLLLKLRPLVENNIIKFSSEYLCLCSSCLDKLAKEEVSFGENMSLVEEILIEEYLDNVDYTVNYVDEEPFVEISGPEKYIIHGKSFVHFRNYIPDSIKGLAKKGRSIQLPKSAIIESGLLESLTSPIFEDLYHQNSLVNLYDISYLTNRDIDFDILNALHSKEDAQKSTNLMEGLTHLLPVLRDTSIEKIVNLRLKDGEAFSVYRDSLSSVVKGNHNYNSKELKGIFRDKINPELNKIEQTIKRNRKHLTGSIVKDIIFVSSIASIGLYSGLLPKDIGKIVAAVGGTRLLYDMYNKMGKALTSDEEIEKSSYYFLWKLQK